jgi:hypothetical protein
VHHALTTLLSATSRSGPAVYCDRRNERRRFDRQRCSKKSTSCNEKAAQIIARPGPVPLVSGGNVWRSSQGGPMRSVPRSLLRFGLCGSKRLPLLKAPDLISERSPRGGLSVCDAYCDAFVRYWY